MKLKKLFIGVFIIMFMVVLWFLITYVGELFLLLILILGAVFFLYELKPNIRFYRDIKAYAISGYTVERREGRFIYKNLLEEDMNNNYILREVGSHIYTINHIEKEIHIYK
ncbi:MAG: hypothetical protein IJA18_02300 [Ruminococcus sp.]|nr:hypothetical protein [Ruminococcus sp.]